MAKQKKLKRECFFQQKCFLSEPKTLASFSGVSFVEKHERNKWRHTKNLIKYFKFFVLFFLFHPSLRNTYSANIFRWLAPFYVNFKERPKGAYIKYVGGVGPEGFTIFLKVFRSPGDHRPKYFMAQ